MAPQAPVMAIGRLTLDDCRKHSWALVALASISPACDDAP